MPKPPATGNTNTDKDKIRDQETNQLKRVKDDTMIARIRPRKPVPGADADQDLLIGAMQDLVQLFWSQGLQLESVVVKWSPEQTFTVEANGKPRQNR